MSFIRSHLLKKIDKEVNNKQDSINLNSFFYFDKSVNNNEEIIDRIDRYSIYGKEKERPLLKSRVSGKALLDIFLRIKNNDFFFYKKVNGKYHRIRFKK
jgi:hypothetical protein